MKRSRSVPEWWIRLVRAVRLNVSGLLALVADLLAGRNLGAVSREVAVLTAVVAFATIDTFA